MVYSVFVLEEQIHKNLTRQCALWSFIENKELYTCAHTLHRYSHLKKLVATLKLSSLIGILSFII